MLSLRERLQQSVPPLTAASQLAAARGFNRPVSLRELLLSCDVVVFKHTISTPSGTALGGWIEVRMDARGWYLFKGHLHDSGLDPYDFRLHVGLRTDRMGLSLRKTGHVAGSLSSGDDDCDWSEEGFSLPLRQFWPELRAGAFTVSFQYEDVGLLGTVEDLAKDFVHWFVGSLAVGGPIAAVIVLGHELGQLTGVHFAQPGLLEGLLVAGGAVFVLGPGVLIPALIAGAAIAAAFRSRELHEDEKALARRVFHGTLPFDRIRITNVHRPGSGAFCWPHPDGTILVNLGDAYDEPIKDGTDRAPVFIHELVHAWQIAHRAWPVDLIWKSLIGQTDREGSYHFSYSGGDWDRDLHIEGQASAVAAWFNAFNNCGPPAPGEPPDCLDRDMATGTPLYSYISQHIRLATG